MKKNEFNNLRNDIIYIENEFEKLKKTLEVYTYMWTLYTEKKKRKKNLMVIHFAL